MPAKPPPRVQLTSTSTLGALKDEINGILGKALELSDEDIAELPRMTLMTGRTKWSDVCTVRDLVQAVGGLSTIKYGTVTVTLDSIDCRDPPRRNLAEEAENESIRIKQESEALAASRTKRVRPSKVAKRSSIT